MTLRFFSHLTQKVLKYTLILLAQLLMNGGILLDYFLWYDYAPWCRNQLRVDVIHQVHKVVDLVSRDTLLTVSYTTMKRISWSPLPPYRPNNRSITEEWKTLQ